VAIRDATEVNALPGDVIVGAWDLRERTSYAEVLRVSRGLPLVAVYVVDVDGTLADDYGLRRSLAPGWCAVVAPDALAAAIRRHAEPCSGMIGFGPHHAGMWFDGDNAAVALTIADVFANGQGGVTLSQAARRVGRGVTALERAVTRHAGRSLHELVTMVSVARLVRRLLWHDQHLASAARALLVNERTARRRLSRWNVDPACLRGARGRQHARDALRRMAEGGHG
jgi:hypothetical protein